MKYLVTGLGNPGEEYENTRHNIGFKVLEKLASDLGTEWEKAKYGWVSKAGFKGRSLLLLKPDTYMNLSGKAVAYYMQQEKLKPENILVITDDLALPTGRLRLKLKGNDGGHNGLKSIDETLGTQNYARLRFGIGSEFQRGRQVEYVLGQFEPNEKENVEKAIVLAADAVKSFATIGPSHTITAVNAKN